MKTLALNSVQNNESQLKSLSQVMNAMGKAIVEHVKSEDTMAVIMAICVVFVMAAVVMNDVVMIAASGGVFLFTLLSMLCRWTKLPEEK